MSYIRTLTPDELKVQYDKFLRGVNSEFTGPRKSDLNIMCESLSYQLALAPASSYNSYHNCYPGGLLDHIHRTIANVDMYYELWGKMLGIEFTMPREEIMFGAFFHDLGKVGMPNGVERYIPTKSDWHAEHRGRMFDVNPAISLSIMDNTFYLLNAYGIQYSANEMLIIRLIKGAFDGNNRHYLMGDTFSLGQLPEHELLYQAKKVAVIYERQQWNR